jgi:hypothetical protein
MLFYLQSTDILVMLLVSSRIALELHVCRQNLLGEGAARRFFTDVLVLLVALEQCFPNGVPRNPGIPRSESKDSSRKNPLEYKI